jgi:predicted nucleic acid-binding protein
MGHRQVTDAYLLALAIKTCFKLVTFDSGIKQLLGIERERAAHIHVLGKG